MNNKIRRCFKRLRYCFKKELKNTVIGGTFALALVSCVASIGSIGEPGFTWDKLPVVLIIAGVSLAYIILVGYANRPLPEEPEQSGRKKHKEEAA